MGHRYLSHKTPLCNSIVMLLLFFAPMTLEARKPRTFLLVPSIISNIQAEIRSGTKEYDAALKRLIREADSALGQVPVSVMEKKQVPPSGDKHDYMSLAPYWWPDPEKANGLAYIRKDGEVNPEREDVTDRKNIRTMTSSVFTLSVAYFFTDHESYADHASQMLRAWFLNP